MAELLKLGQYDLDGFVFGTRTPWNVKSDFLVGEFGVAPGEIKNFDVSLPDEDGTNFGVDTHSGMNIQFKILLWRRGEPALDDLGRIQSVWQDKNKRLTPGAVTTLRMNKQGRTRIAYGRPRNFLPGYGAVERGFSECSAEFLCVDETFYDDEQSFIELEMANPPISGLRMPFNTPLRVSQRLPSYGSFGIGGVKETWPTFIIKGPVINPTVEVLGKYKFSLNVALNYQQKITIDPRPWQRMTLLDGVTNRSGRYTIDSVTLPDMALGPGLYSVVYTGLDETLSSSLMVGWRSAWTTP